MHFTVSLAFFRELSLYWRMTNSNNNPDKLTKAVAIKGAESGADSSTAAPPQIVAKGSGELAEKILDVAFAKGIKVRQDKDLTELLDAFEVDSPIPLEALHTVSLILERVYAENQKLAETNTTDTFTPREKASTLDGITGEPVPVDEGQHSMNRKGQSDAG